MIYADNAATTSLHASVLDAMMPYLTGTYGNPSSQHAAGRAAAEAVRDARATVAACLGCAPREVVFTASGSESDNQAIATGVAWGAARGRRHVVASAIEHPAVLRALERLERAGDVQVTYVRPAADGVVSAAAVRAAVRPGQTCLVTVMAANNETGAVQPVGEIAAVAHEAGALFHTDAVQAVGQVPLRLGAGGEATSGGGAVPAIRVDADLLTLSAHKFHGPKGVGALVCRAQTLGGPLAPAAIVVGGAQERGHRAGTENVPGVVGLAAALREACARVAAAPAADGAAAAGSPTAIAALRDRLAHGLLDIPDARLMGPADPARRCPGIVCACFGGVHREALVALLDQAGVCASAGAACAAGAVATSHVLRAMGVDDRLAAGSLRLSLGEDATADDVDAIVRATRAAVARLRAVDAEEDW